MAIKGEVAYLYAFDVANEIVTAKVQEILSKKPFPFTVRSDRTYPKDLPLYAPLAIEPAPPESKLRGQKVGVLIRVYDVGVVTVAMRVPFEVEALLDLLPLHDPTLDTGQTLDAVAQELCIKVCQSLKEFMVRSSPPSVPEAYTAFCVTHIDDVSNVTDWIAGQRRTVAGLLTETEPSRLSDRQVDEVLGLQCSFENSDLVVVDWDAALVVDLSGYTDDVLFVLELANLQLEEFRVLDRMLDRYLDRAYEDLEPRGWSLFGTSTAVLRKLRRFRIDLAKLADEVTHITKFFGDWHLARVYLATRKRFHLDHWRASVEQRLAQLDQLYSVVNSEINERRMLWLEAAIVVLFLIDLAALLFWKK